jgi:hypothetical protein
VRLWKKAQKNIEAVERGIVVGEKGVFPFGALSGWGVCFTTQCTKAVDIERLSYVTIGN